MTLPFVHHTRVRFAHVDGAGIVFYPRWFEMLNEAMEEWFAGPLGRDFHALHIEDRIGTPTVRLECDFAHPGMLGDRIDIALAPERVGTSSCSLRFTFGRGDETLLSGLAILVCMDLETQRSRPWPDSIGAAMRAALA